jgi:hypothetical protein
MKFTLKVIKNKKTGTLYADTRHPLGGVDTDQAFAFQHLFPSGCVTWMFEETLKFLASVHDWDVSIEYGNTEY